MKMIVGFRIFYLKEKVRTETNVERKRRTREIESERKTNLKWLSPASTGWWLWALRTNVKHRLIHVVCCNCCMAVPTMLSLLLTMYTIHVSRTLSMVCYSQNECKREHIISPSIRFEFDPEINRRNGKSRPKKRKREKERNANKQKVEERTKIVLSTENVMRIKIHVNRFRFLFRCLSLWGRFLCRFTRNSKLYFECRKRTFVSTAQTHIRIHTHI